MELLPNATRGPVAYKVQGKTVIFEPLASLEPGTTMEYEVFTRALIAGDMRFKIQNDRRSTERRQIGERRGKHHGLQRGSARAKIKVGQAF